MQRNFVIGVGYQLHTPQNTPLELTYNGVHRFVAVFTGHAFALVPAELLPLWQKARHVPVHRDEVRKVLNQTYSAEDAAEIEEHLNATRVFSVLGLDLTRYQMVCRGPDGEVLSANKLGEECASELLKAGWGLEVALSEAKGDLMRSVLENGDA